MKKTLLVNLILCLGFTSFAQDIKINSSSEELVNSFEWAKEKARSYVMTGKRGPINISERNRASEDVDYIPSYWAGYPLRTAFYSRDFCHQVVGAHLLGLHEENYSMLKAFALSATKERKWYPLWAINFDGSPYLLDYRNDTNFVREVPAVFEIVEKAYELYRWTGDKRYIKDQSLWYYYTKAVTEFIELHDTQFPNNVAEGTGEGNIFKGVATFNEHRDIPFIEAGDGIACQYQALLSYSKLAHLRGDNETGELFEEKAEWLKNYFNTEWGVKETTLFNRGYTMAQLPVDGWGKENSWFILMKGIADTQSDRYKQYLQYIDERLESREDIPENIEALSYIPEIFFQYHKDDLGWKWMQYIMHSISDEHVADRLTGSNGDYPEVSYVLISNIIVNLLGISPCIYENKVYTLSHLPSEINFIQGENIGVGNRKIKVTHQGKMLTSFVYQEGIGELEWNAGFAGEYDHLYINGKKEVCVKHNEYGTVCSYYSLNMKPGDEVTVSVNP